MSSTLRVADSVLFREVSPVVLSSDRIAARDRFWRKACRANPALYDGHILLVSAFEWSADTCEISFFESSFSYFLWARNACLDENCRALFAAVVAITTDGALLAGRMSRSTSTPYRIQLPGGNISGAMVQSYRW